MTSLSPDRCSRLGRWCLFNAVLVSGLILHLVFMAFPSTEAVRLRNALLMAEAPSQRVDWVPPSYPPDFRVEVLPPDPRLVGVVRTIGADRGPDLARMLAIAAHLAENARDTGPIQADTWTAYKAIRAGGGYCADFTQVFLALAHAAGIPAREWAFSFDGFGGWGHGVVEAYDRQRGKWIFLDVYNNFHVVDRWTREPLDVEAWRRAVRRGADDVDVIANGPGRPGFSRREKLLDYYRRGLDGWYLWLGNDTETYDRHPLVSLAGQLSRSLEQLAAMAAGVHPRILVLGSAANQAAFLRMQGLRQQLLVELPLLALASLCLPFLAWSWWRRRQELEMTLAGPPAVALVGPVAPPAGGMASQCSQLAQRLAAAGVKVELVPTNLYRPAAVAGLKGLREPFRLFPYLFRLWRAAGRCDLVHILANSGWAWRLIAVPAIRIARWRGRPVVVHYHGGHAGDFFRRHHRALHTLDAADWLVVPSDYLRRIFHELGRGGQVIPNLVNLERFRPVHRPPCGSAPHLAVTRNLEAIYDLPTAIRAFVRIRQSYPGARLTIAGSGPEEGRLKALVASLGLGGAVHFSGRVANEAMPALYAQADCLLNPSTVDNMPISILEALASGVPVVSTSAGGIPDLVRDGETALLVPVGDDAAMAEAALAVLGDAALATALSENGLKLVERFAGDTVIRQWLALYRGLLPQRRLA